MSYVKVPFADIRIPRVQVGLLGGNVRKLYEMFGLRAHIFAGNLEEETVAVIATPAEWESEQFLQEVFDRIVAGTIAQLAPTFVMPVHLNPPEFVFASRDLGTVDEILLYRALDIKYCVVFRNGDHDSEKFIVPRGGLRHALRSVTKAEKHSGSMTSCIGSMKAANELVGFRTGRVADHDQPLPLPETVTFAEIYTHANTSVMTLAKLFGAKYHNFDLDRIALEVPQNVSHGVVCVLNGFGRSSVERVKAYCAMLCAAAAVRPRAALAYDFEADAATVEKAVVSLEKAVASAVSAVEALAEPVAEPVMAAELGEAVPVAKKRTFAEAN